MYLNRNGIFKIYILVYFLLSDVNGQSNTETNVTYAMTSSSWLEMTSVPVDLESTEDPFIAADLPWYIENYPSFNDSVIIKYQIKFRFLPGREETEKLKYLDMLMTYGKWTVLFGGYYRIYDNMKSPNILDKYTDLSYETRNFTVMCSFLISDFRASVVCTHPSEYLFNYVFKPWSWDYFRSMWKNAPVARQDVILSAILLSLGLTGNVLTVILFHLKRNRSATNIFLGSLAVADLLLVLVSVPKSFFTFHFNQNTIFVTGLCEFAQYFEFLLGFAAINNLVTVAYERFLALVYPMKAHRISSHKRALTIVIGLWVFSAIEALPMVWYMRSYPTFIRGGTEHYVCFMRIQVHHDGNLAYPLYRTYLFLLMFLIPCLMQGYFYIRTCWVLYKTMKESHLTEGQNKGGSDPNEERTKVVIMLVALWIFYMIFWGPRLIVTWVDTWFTSFRVLDSTLAYFYKWSYINNVINFFIYFITSKRLRNEYIRIITCNVVKPKAQLASNATGQSQLSVSQAQSSTNI